MRSPRVLVFDSGIGGLSIASCIHQQLPGTHLIYVADNACFPYGDQPEPVVVERSQSLIASALAEYPCDLIVVACNTASTVVLPNLRAANSTPVVGVVPAVKPAAACSVNRRIGILATPATIRRPYLEALIAEFASDCLVERVGHPQLVRWIEEAVSGKPLPMEELCRALAPFRTQGVDTVVLGCTHYPLIRSALRQCLPEVNHWVDSGEAIARRIAWLLEQQGFTDVRAPVTARSATPEGAPLQAALFSGEPPLGLAEYLGRMGLSAAEIRGHWLRYEQSVRGVGSA